MTYLIANRTVEMSGKGTWLETLQRNNFAGKTLAPASLYAKLIREKDEKGNRPPTTSELRKLPRTYIGTLGAVGAIGKPIEKRVESECQYDGSLKLVV